MPNTKTRKKLKESVAYEDLGPAMVTPTAALPDYAKSVQKLTPPQAHPIVDAPAAPPAAPAAAPAEDEEPKPKAGPEGEDEDVPVEEEGEIAPVEDEGEKKEVVEADEDLDKVFTEMMKKLREGDEEEECVECDDEEGEEKTVAEARKARIKKMMEARKRRLREEADVDENGLPKKAEPPTAPAPAPVAEDDEEEDGTEEDGVVVREITEDDEEEPKEEKPKAEEPKAEGEPKEEPKPAVAEADAADAPKAPDTAEDEKAMFAGETLPESFKSKASTIFRAAVARTVAEERKRLNVKFSRKMAEGFELMKGELGKKQAAYESKLADKVDLYLSYVVENWMEANKIAVERGIRTELTEDFIRGLKSLFTEHYIEVPEDKVDVLKQMETKVTELESKLNEQVELGAKMRTALRGFRKEEVLRKATAGMAASQVEKFRSLAEGVEYTTKAEYEKKLATIRENYFKTSPKKPVAATITEENVPVVKETSDSPAMDLYAKTLSKTKRS